MSLHQISLKFFSLLIIFVLCFNLINADSSSKHSSKHGKKPHKSDNDNSDDNKINTTLLYTGATALPSKIQSFSSLPEKFDWCNIDGQSFCVPSWNQHIPRYCGSCYVHGALHAANDRIKILMRGLQDIQLARQVILNCGPINGLGAGCDGGEGFDVFEFMHRFGLPDESCQIYKAKASEQCNAEAYCHNCMPLGEEIWPYKCWAVENPIRYYADSYGSVRGELAMMSEIHARGPITCGFASVDDFDYNYRGGIYVDLTNATELNHDVEIVGWGEENGVKYWKARNSWGTYWGENSFFKIARGINNMQIESDCVFAILDTHMLEKVLDGKLGGSMFGLVRRHDEIFNRSEKEEHQHHSHKNVDHSDRVIASHKLASKNYRETKNPFEQKIPVTTADFIDPHRLIELSVIQSYQNEKLRGFSSSDTIIKKESDDRHNDEKMIELSLLTALIKSDGNINAIKPLIQAAFVKLENFASSDNSSQSDVDVVEEEIRSAWKDSKNEYSKNKNHKNFIKENENNEEIINQWFKTSKDENKNNNNYNEINNIETNSFMQNMINKQQATSLLLPTVFGMIIGVALSVLAVTSCKARHDRGDYQRL